MVASRLCFSTVISRKLGDTHRHEFVIAWPATEIDLHLEEEFLSRINPLIFLQAICDRA